VAAPPGEAFVIPGEQFRALARAHHVRSARTVRNTQRAPLALGARARARRPRDGRAADSTRPHRRSGASRRVGSWRPGSGPAPPCSGRRFWRVDSAASRSESRSPVLPGRSPSRSPVR